MKLSLYGKQGNEICILRNFTYSSGFLGEKNISAEINSSDDLSIGVGSYCTFNNEVFTIISPSDIKRNARNSTANDSLVYNITLHSKQYELAFCMMLDYVLQSDDSRFAGQGGRTSISMVVSMTLQDVFRQT